MHCFVGRELAQQISLLLAHCRHTFLRSFAEAAREIASARRSLNADVSDLTTAVGDFGTDLLGSDSLHRALESALDVPASTDSEGVAGSGVEHSPHLPYLR